MNYVLTLTLTPASVAQASNGPLQATPLTAPPPLSPTLAPIDPPAVSLRGEHL